MRPSDAPGRGRTVTVILLSGVGSLILATDVVIGFPALLAVLGDPTSHAAQDAGMTAVFLLLPIALAGISCLALGYALWRTRAGAIALATATAAVVMIIGNVAGIPLLIPAIGVALSGSLLVAWTLARAVRNMTRH